MLKFDLLVFRENLIIFINLNLFSKTFLVS